jgi:hypothetical protein
VSPLDQESLADFASDLVGGNESVRKAVQYEKKVGHLRDDMGWRYLLERIKAQKEAFMLGIARGLMSGKKPDEVTLAYMRGFYDGAIDTALQPEKAAQNLERQARKAIIEAATETAQGAESPYN